MENYKEEEEEEIIDNYKRRKSRTRRTGTRIDEVEYMNN